MATRSRGNIILARYVCETCGKSFHRKTNFTEHKCKGVREKEDPICDICGMLFSRKYDIKRHRRNVHAERHRPRRSDRRGRSVADRKREETEDLERRLSNEQYHGMEVDDIDPVIGRGVFATIPNFNSFISLIRIFSY